MRKWKKQIIRLATKEALLSVFDLTTPFFRADHLYRKSVDKYLEKRVVDRSQFLDKLRYWRNLGYIDSFMKNKDHYIELTKKGKRALQGTGEEEVKVENTNSWDGKWRIVIFDIPESQRDSRDILRAKLKQIGFLQVQKSVYIFPFECSRGIHELVDRLKINNLVIILIADIIEGEEKIINIFLEKEILHINQIKKIPKVTHDRK